jgi:flagellar operon protein
MTPVEHNPALLPPGVLAGTGPHPTRTNGRTGAVAPSGGPSFADVLRTQQREPVRFSAHALQRVERRGIDVGPATLGRLNEGVDRAAGKGARASVVFVDGTAFVVSVPNRTVITAVDRDHMKQQVFTNIDSAVIA